MSAPRVPGRSWAPDGSSAMPDATLHLYDPRRGEPGLRVDPLGDECRLDEPQKSNYFTLLWIHAGRGTFWADLTQFPFEDQHLLFFTPYQTLKFDPHTTVSGLRI